MENNKIRKQYRDPRIHFVLNCASESCPIARPELPVGNDLEHLMQRATTDFINDPSNVTVDHDQKTVYLSTIFKWYEEDFVNDVRLDNQSIGNGLLNYVKKYAAGALLDDVAQASDYKIEYREYDWGLNSTH